MVGSGASSIHALDRDSILSQPTLTNIESDHHQIAREKHSNTQQTDNKEAEATNGRQSVKAICLTAHIANTNLPDQDAPGPCAPFRFSTRLASCNLLSWLVERLRRCDDQERVRPGDGSIRLTSPLRHEVATRAHGEYARIRSNGHDTTRRNEQSDRQRLLELSANRPTGMSSANAQHDSIGAFAVLPAGLKAASASWKSFARAPSRHLRE